MGHAWQPGQLVFAGFEGTEPPGELVKLVADGRLGGVVLFTRNLASTSTRDGTTVLDARKIRGLVRTLRIAAPPDAPLVLAIDQEGGRVQRLRAPWTEWPPMRRLGELGELEATARLAEALAIELTELGVGLDFAPVVDVDTNPDNPIIGDRSFGRTPEQVSAHAVRFIERMQALGVATCAKHFPGHGDTRQDSHLELPRLPHDLDRLRAVELVPFADAARAGVASIMTAHVVFEAIDRKRPATLSPDVMAILREQIGYDGLVFSDDLEMKAVADHHRPAALVRGALEAGVDALLVCKEIGLVREVLEALERSPDALLERSLARMIAFKEAFPQPPVPEPDGPRPPYPDHRAFAERLRSGKLAGDVA